MKTISLKMPEDLDAELEDAARRSGRSKSLLVRMALSKFLPGRARGGDRSFLSRVADLAGCLEAERDLSTSKHGLKGYGR